MASGNGGGPLFCRNIDWAAYGISGKDIEEIFRDAARAWAYSNNPHVFRDAVDAAEYTAKLIQKVLGRKSTHPSWEDILKRYSVEPAVDQIDEAAYTLPDKVISELREWVRDYARMFGYLDACIAGAFARKNTRAVGQLEGKRRRLSKAVLGSRYGRWIYRNDGFMETAYITSCIADSWDPVAYRRGKESRAWDLDERLTKLLWENPTVDSLKLLAFNILPKAEREGIMNDLELDVPDQGVGEIYHKLGSRLLAEAADKYLLNRVKRRRYFARKPELATWDKEDLSFPDRETRAKAIELAHIEQGKHMCNDCNCGWGLQDAAWWGEMMEVSESEQEVDISDDEEFEEGEARRDNGDKNVVSLTIKLAEATHIIEAPENSAIADAVDRWCGSKGLVCQKMEEWAEDRWIDAEGRQTYDGVIIRITTVVDTEYISSLRSRLLDLEQQCALLTGQNGDLQKQLSVAHTSVERKQIAIDLANDRIDGYEAKIAELSALNEKLAKDLAEAAGELADKDEKIAELKRRLREEYVPKDKSTTKRKPEESEEDSDADYESAPENPQPQDQGGFWSFISWPVNKIRDARTWVFERTKDLGRQVAGFFSQSLSDQFTSFVKSAWDFVKKMVKGALDKMGLVVFALLVLGVLVAAGFLGYKVLNFIIISVCGMLGIAVPEWLSKVFGPKRDITEKYDARIPEYMRSSAVRWYLKRKDGSGDEESDVIELSGVASIWSPDDKQGEEVLSLMHNEMKANAPHMIKRFCLGVDASNPSMRYHSRALKNMMADCLDIEAVQADLPEEWKRKRGVLKRVAFQVEEDGESVKNGSAGAVGPLAGLIGLLGTLYLGTCPDTSSLAKANAWVRTALGLSAVAAISFSVVDLMTRFMPLTFVYWMKKKINRVGDRDMDKWVDFAIHLLSQKKIPEIVRLKSFRKDLEECLRGGREFVTASEPGVRATTLPYFNQLLMLYSNVKALGDVQGARDMPTCVHFFGSSGLGKSIWTPAIVNCLTGAGPEEQYAYPLSNDYWNGFHSGKKVIVWDEFGAHTEVNQMSTRQMNDFLQLVSTMDFSPNMADLDSSSLAGSKGTKARPDWVILFGNHPFPLPIVSESAIYSRRHALVEIKVVNEYSKNGRVDLRKLKADRRITDPTLPALAMRFVDPLRQPDGMAKIVSPWMSWPDMCLALKKLRKEHQSLARAIAPLRSKTNQPVDMEEAYELSVRAFKNAGDDLVVPPAIVAEGRLGPGGRIKPLAPSEETYNRAVRKMAEFKARITECSECADEPTNGELCDGCADNLDEFQQVELGLEFQRKHLPARHKGMEKATSTLSVKRPDVSEEARAAIESSFVRSTEEYATTDGFGTDHTIKAEDVSWGWKVAATVAFGSLAAGLATAAKRFMGKGDDMTILEEDAVEAHKQSGVKTSTSTNYSSRSHSERAHRMGAHRVSFKNGGEAKIARAVAEVSFYYTGKDGCRHVSTMHGFFHEGHVFFPRHFIVDYKENGDMVKKTDYITVTYRDPQSGTKSINLDFKNYPVVISDEQDIACVQYPASVITGRPSILKFLSEEEMYKLPELLVGITDLSGRTTPSTATLVRHNKIWYPYDNGGEHHFEPNELVRYHGEFKEGDCGRLVMAESNPYVGITLGFHVCSTRASTGYAQVITREIIDNMLGVRCMSPDQDEITFKDGGKVEIGQVSRQEMYFVPTRSKLVATDLVFSWEPLVAPAELSKSKLDEMMQRTLDVAADLPELDEKQLIVLDKAASDMTCTMLKGLHRRPVERELTVEEAIVGIPGLFKGLDLDTSPGWPYVKSVKNKRSLVSTEGKIISRELTARMQDMCEYIECGGEAPECDTLCYLKDETRDIAKTGKPRIIASCPLDLTIKARMIYGPVKIAMESNWEELPTFVGVNPMSDDIAKRPRAAIRKFKAERIFIDGDYSGFDMRLLKPVLDRAFGVMEEMGVHLLGERYRPQFSRMASLICNMRVRWNGKWVYLIHGQRSGNPVTTPLNCVSNGIIFRYCFYRALEDLPDGDERKDASYEDHVEDEFHGDDNRAGVDPAFHDVFNVLTITKYARELGQIYTSAEKELYQEAKWKTLEETTILGRHPTKYGNLYYGALNKDSIEQMPMYINKGTYIGDVFCAMITEAALWGTTYFNTMVRELRTANAEATQHALSLTPVKSIDQWRKQCAEGVTADLYFRATKQVGSQPGHGEDPVANLVEDVGITALVVEGESKEIGPSEAWVDNRHLASRTLAEPVMSSALGPQMFVLRQTLVVTRGAELIVGAWKIPQDLVGWEYACGDQTLQDVNLAQFIYWHGSFHVKFAFNGNPFYKGMVMLAYFPGIKRKEDAPRDWYKVLGYQHAFVDLSKNSVQTMKIPFIFKRNALNTYALDEDDEMLGMLVMYRVALSELAGDAMVTISTAMPDADFTVLKPRTTAARDRRHNWSNDKVEAVKQGGGMSTHTSTTNIINDFSGAIVGDVPMEITDGSVTDSSGAQVDAQLDATIPMDKPPVVGGGVPVFTQAPSLSTMTGMVPCKTVGEHPQETLTNGLAVYGTAGDNFTFNSLLGRPEYLGAFSLAKDTPARQVMFTYPLHFGTQAESEPYPNSTILGDLFRFWHADIIIEGLIVKDGYTTCALRLTTTFGSKAAPSYDQARTQYNRVEQFGRDRSRFKVEIPWIAATQWLRTDSGEGMRDLTQDTSFGFFRIFNEAPIGTAQATSAGVGVFLFIRHGNLRLAVPRMLGVVPRQAVEPAGAEEKINPLQIGKIEKFDTVTLRTVPTRTNKKTVSAHTKPWSFREMFNEAAKQGLTKEVKDTDTKSDDASNMTTAPSSGEEIKADPVAMTKARPAQKAGPRRVEPREQISFPVTSYHTAMRRFKPLICHPQNVHEAVVIANNCPTQAAFAYPVDGKLTAAIPTELKRWTHAVEIYSYPVVPPVQTFASYWKGGMTYRVALGRVTQGLHPFFFWVPSDVGARQHSHPSVLADLVATQAVKGAIGKRFTGGPEWAVGDSAGTGNLYTTYQWESFTTVDMLEAQTTIRIPDRNMMNFRTVDDPNGFLVIVVPSKTPVSVFVAIGDDLRFGVFRNDTKQNSSASAPNDGEPLALAAEVDTDFIDTYKYAFGNAYTFAGKVPAHATRESNSVS